MALTGAILIVFTACWVTLAVPLPMDAHCDVLKADVLKTLSVFDPYTLFTAGCYPIGTDLQALERERLETLACIWPPVTEPPVLPPRAEVDDPS